MFVPKPFKDIGLKKGIEILRVKITAKHVLLSLHFILAKCIRHVDRARVPQIDQV